jgi:hypothetical protein
MLLPIKPICTVAKIKKDGTSPIFFQYCFSSKHRTLLNTGITIPLSFWLTKHLKISEHLPEKYGLSSKLNEELIRMKRVVEDLILHATKHEMKDKNAFVKATIAPTFNLFEIGEKVNQGFKRKMHNKKLISIFTTSLMNI